MTEIHDMIASLDSKIKLQAIEIDRLTKDLNIKKIALKNEIQALERIVLAAKSPEDTE